MQLPKLVEQAAILIPAPVIDAAGIARLLGTATATFHNRRGLLESHGFPKKLPGLNGWSSACVLRWIETNGDSYLPAPPATPRPPRTRLDERYAS